MGTISLFMKYPVESMVPEQIVKSVGEGEADGRAKHASEINGRLFFILSLFSDMLNHCHPIKPH